MTKVSWKVLMAVLSTVNPDVRVEKEARFLASEGHDVTILAANPSGALPASEERDGYKIIRFPIKKKLFFKYFEFWKHVRNYIRGKSYDIIHLHDLNVLPVAPKVSSYTRAIVYDSHENFPEQMSETYGLLAYWVYYLMEKRYIKFANQIVTVGETYVENIRRKYHRDSTGICNYPSIIDVEQAHAKEIPVEYKKRAKLRVVYFGVMYRNLGYDKVVRAAKILSDRFTPNDIEFQIIGSGPAYYTMIKLIDRYQLGEYFTLTGWMNYHDALSIMREADIGLILFQPGGNNYLRIPNRLYDYCSAGLAFIGSNYPGIISGTKFSKSFGLYVNPTSPQDIADAIETMYNNPKMLAQMKQTARKAFEQQFNWESEVPKLLDVYKKALEEQ